MATFTLTKTPLTDDVAPSGAGYAGRTFTVPTTVDDGTARPSGGLYVRAEVKTAGGVAVADGVLTVSLWLKIGGSGGTWTQIGDPQTVPRGRRVILPFGDLDIDTPGAVQITSVTGTGAASVDLVCEVGVAPPTQVGQTGLPKMEPTALYKAAPPVLAEGDTTPLLTDTAGNIKVAIAGSAGGTTFPAAASLGDATANPTTTLIGSLLEGFNGTTWDRLRTGLTAVQTAFTGMLNTLPFGKFNLSRPVLADTNGVALQINQRGDLSVVEQQAPDYEDNANDVAWINERAVADVSALSGPWALYSSGATLIGNLGLSIKTTAGRLRAIVAVNKHATNLYYLVVVDKASAPVANDAAIWSIPLAPYAAATHGMSGPTVAFPGGLKCLNGIAFAISTDPQKVTLGGADCVVLAQYL